MAEDDTGGGKAHDANKRPRLDDAAVSGQRAAFAEDMALIRSAVGRGESGEGEGEGEGAPPAPDGNGGEEECAPSQQQGGESTVQSPQPSGESTSQHRPTGTGAGRPSAEAAGALESDDDEEGEGHWLKNFTPHHTRVGAAYQVAELPAASPPSAAAPARASGSCVSPGSSS